MKNSYKITFILSTLLLFNARTSAALTAQNKSNSYGTPLHEACLNRNPELAKALLQKGTDPNIKSVVVSTPLILTIKGFFFLNPQNPNYEKIRAQYLSLIEALMCTKADLMAQDKQGKTAADIAQINGDTELTKLLSPDPN